MPITAAQQLIRVALSFKNKLINAVTFRHARLQREHGKTHLRDKEFQHPVLQLNELSRAVGRFADEDEPSGFRGIQ